LRKPLDQARLPAQNACAQAKLARGLEEIGMAESATSRAPGTEKLAVCLEFPAFHGEEYLERLRSLPGVEPIVLPVDPEAEWATLSPSEPWVEPPPWAESFAEERRAALARAQVIVALHTQKELMKLAPQLQWIQGCGAGMEQFSGLGARRAGVIVTNASGVSSGSMAEWVVGRLLQVWKRFREADAHQQQHAFERTYGASMKGKTVGIVGLGAIGRETSVRLRAFGCRVLGLKRSAVAGAVSEHADALFAPDALHEMLAQSDAVVVAAPAVPETYHLIDAAALAAMRPDAILVNVARGSLVDEVALAEAMRSQSIAAAVLDVFDPEPLDPKSPLWDLPGVYVSAHSSVSVDRYMDDLFEFFFENLQRYRAGEPLKNQLDLEVLEFE
jgi:phosphoglycerate dehydrogenase-like enzyme